MWRMYSDGIKNGKNTGVIQRVTEAPPISHQRNVCALYVRFFNRLALMMCMCRSIYVECAAPSTRLAHLKSEKKSLLHYIPTDEQV